MTHYITLRSHAVLQVTVEASRLTVGAQHTVQTGRLYMVDLAGSERAAQTQVYIIGMECYPTLARVWLFLGITESYGVP